MPAADLHAPPTRTRHGVPHGGPDLACCREPVDIDHGLFPHLVRRHPPLATPGAHVWARQVPCSCPVLLAAIRRKREQHRFALLLGTHRVTQHERHAADKPVRYQRPTGIRPEEALVFSGSKVGRAHHPVPAHDRQCALAFVLGEVPRCPHRAQHRSDPIGDGDQHAAAQQIQGDLPEQMPYWYKTRMPDLMHLPQQDQAAQTRGQGHVSPPQRTRITAPREERRQREQRHQREHQQHHEMRRVRSRVADQGAQDRESQDADAQPPRLALAMGQCAGDEQQERGQEHDLGAREAQAVEIDHLLAEGRRGPGLDHQAIDDICQRQEREQQRQRAAARGGQRAARSAHRADRCR